MATEAKDRPRDALDDEIDAYERMRARLEADFFGKWIVVHGGEFIDAFSRFEEAADDAIARFGQGPYLIRQVGEKPLELPPSLLYGIR